MSASPAMYGVKRLSHVGGNTAPSRNAAIGGTRVALRAGANDAASVTPTPTASGTITPGHRWTLIPASGRPKPTALKSAPSSFANPTPARMPSTEAMSPTITASPSTVVSICRRMAPMVRSIANSRMRWATVIEKVLKMTNAPTSTAAPANASNAGVKNELIAPEIWSVCSFAASVPVCTFTQPGSCAAIRCLSSFGETPESPSTEIVDVLPTRSYQRWASANVVATTVAPPIDDTLPNRNTPTIVTGCTPWSVVRPTCWPTCRLWSSASCWISATWPDASGYWPSTSVFWLNGFGSVETTRFGAPPCDATNLPFTTSDPIPWIWPSAFATPSIPRTRWISEAGSGPTWSCPVPLPNAGLRLR